jgi:hypothetical protein
MVAVVLGVDWVAVTAIAGVAAAAVAVATKLLLPAVQTLRDPTRRRREASDAYEAQLKVTAKAIDDTAARRQAMSTAQNELNELSKREEQLRREFGRGSAVNWVARINRGMLRRAFDMASTSSPNPEFGDLINHGVDEAGLRAFENERDAAMRSRKPVHTFATDEGELSRLAKLAELEPPYDEQFEKLVADSGSALARGDATGV